MQLQVQYVRVYIGVSCQNTLERSVCLANYTLPVGTQYACNCGVDVTALLPPVLRMLSVNGRQPETANVAPPLPTASACYRVH